MCIRDRQELEQTKQSYASADHAAKEAQQKQKQSEARLQEQLAQVSQLESQLNQAKMQEHTARTMDTMNQFNTDDVPTLDGVRDKIERRYANALGQQELMKDSMNDRIAEIESGSSDAAASNRLAEIRASMGGELEAGSGASASAADRQLEAGSEGDAADSAETADTGAAEAAGAADDTIADAEAYLRDAESDADAKADADTDAETDSGAER